MKQIESYINEKLKINKDSKLDLNIEIKFPFFFFFFRDMSYHTLIRKAIKEYGIKLDDKARINHPGTVGPHNWTFKFKNMNFLETVKYGN